MGFRNQISVREGKMHEQTEACLLEPGWEVFRAKLQSPVSKEGGVCEKMPPGVARGRKQMVSLRALLVGGEGLTESV